ncbi:MAG: 50S ribosomal protein L21 [Candidatus Pacebacteria bacterium]|nr:50S ribosomal protein L21 [Candidatus Paceibacterota bacterium]
MKAVILTGGKQYIVEKDQVLTIEKIKNAKTGDVVSFDKVLLTFENDDIKVGKPYIDGAVVKAEIVEEKRSKKISVIKFKPKTRYHKQFGHRQDLMDVKIAEIKA